MTPSETDVHGSCNCGAIKLIAKGGFGDEKGELCHCNACRKSGGSLAMYFIGIKSESVLVAEGTPKVHTGRAAAGKPVHRRFCGDCGSALWVEVDSMPGMAFVNGPIFNVDQGVGLEIWYQNAHPWERAYAPQEKVLQAQ